FCAARPLALALLDAAGRSAIPHLAARKWRSDALKRTETYRRQHRRLIELAGSISGQLPQGAAAAEPMRAELSKLAGVLKLHLAMEDEGLYPSLKESEDSRIREKAH